MTRIVVPALTIPALLLMLLIEAPQAANLAPSIIVLAKTAGADSTVTEHRDGEAVPLAGRYRVQIGSLEAGALTMPATCLRWPAALGCSFHTIAGDDRWP